MADIVARGIDVSYAQGTIGWRTVSADPAVHFAMVRATASYPHDGKSGIDQMFFANMPGLVASGLPFGFYHYSYAKTAEEMRLEARHFLDTIKDYKPLYPIALDFEDPIQLTYPVSQQLEMIEAFMTILEEAGYYAVLYMSASPMHWLIKEFPATMARYDKWVAHVNVAAPMVEGGIWQHSWKGKVLGITRDVDLNIAYKDYPAIIKAAGKNGWGAAEKPVEPTAKELVLSLSELKEKGVERVVLTL